MIGRLIGEKYRVIDFIGGGGFGAVYRAEQEPVGRIVALKVIKHRSQDEEELRARFLREARSAARLKSPHIVTLFDYGEEPDGTLFMVFEFVEGRTLKDVLLAEKRIPLERASQYAVQILEGLSVAHRAGIVHRDLKPANIMIAAGAWGYEEARVLDFGVAKMLEADADDPLQASTRRGLVLGTPHYMSPEQARTLSIDARADLYAIGTLLFVMVAGRPPFTAQTTFGILQAHVQQPPEEVLDGLEAPAEFKAVLLKALQKKPEQRYADAREMAEALAPFARLHSSDSGTDISAEIETPALMSLTPNAVFTDGPDDSIDLAPPSSDGAHPEPSKDHLWLLIGALCLIAVGLTLWYSSTGGGEEHPVVENQELDAENVHSEDTSVVDQGSAESIDAARSVDATPSPSVDGTPAPSVDATQSQTRPVDASVKAAAPSNAKSPKVPTTEQKKLTGKRPSKGQRRTNVEPKTNRKNDKKSSRKELSLPEF